MIHFKSNEIHVWVVPLLIYEPEIEGLRSLLSPDEIQRAYRLKTNLHQTRFIIAHGILRKIISFYVNLLPDQLIFQYSTYQKPYLPSPYTDLQFNMSHSHDYAAFAITQHAAIGIDIEKILPIQHQEIANRYFSQKENLAISALAKAEQSYAFYRIWSRKEAIIKAIGKGLSMPLDSFTVASDDQVENILVEDKTWSLAPIHINSEYTGAVACEKSIENILYCDFSAQIKQV